MRGVVKETRFEEQLADIEPNVKRADEFVEGAEWTLSRDPTAKGTQVADNSCVWFLPTNDVPAAPSLVIYYTFDEKKVYLLSIQIAA